MDGWKTIAFPIWGRVTFQGLLLSNFGRNCGPKAWSCLPIAQWLVAEWKKCRGTSPSLRSMEYSGPYHSMYFLYMFLRLVCFFNGKCRFEYTKHWCYGLDVCCQLQRILVLMGPNSSSQHLEYAKKNDTRIFFSWEPLQTKSPPFWNLPKQPDLGKLPAIKNFSWDRIPRTITHP